jgi:hypothetical protein
MKKLTLFLFVVLAINTFGQKKINPIENKQSEIINELIDDWHLAAAKGSLDDFFNKMDKNAIYLGTDASEKWTTDELKEFCKIHFADGMGWNFKPIKREIYFNDRKDFAWFDERLNTWMGVCMSSGVLVKIDNIWKIKHYQLSIAIPNDIVKDFIKMVENYNNK